MERYEDVCTKWQCGTEGTCEACARRIFEEVRQHVLEELEGWQLVGADDGDRF